MLKQPALNISQLATGATAITQTHWPVWKDSVFEAPVFPVLSKRIREKIWYTARSWDRQTRKPGKHGGIIGRAALSVLHALLWDFYNLRTGRLDPSVANIASHASLCERATHTALSHLRSLHLLDWVRRCEKAYTAAGRFILQQRTNAYRPFSPEHWLGYRPPPEPEPDRATLGYPERRLDPIEDAIRTIETGDRTQLHARLTVDPTDELALALAALGRQMGAL